ncbi:MAG: tetratricopeptide repeat protein, partial [Planctomycetota bacterium]
MRCSPERSAAVAAAALLGLCLPACTAGGAETDRSDVESYQKSLDATMEELQREARRGEVSAQMELATRYYEGRFVEQDFEKAAEWYGAAAERGIAEAYYSLGVMYEKGQGVVQDDRAAAKAYEVAAEAG